MGFYRLKLNIISITNALLTQTLSMMFRVSAKVYYLCGQTIFMAAVTFLGEYQINILSNVLKISVSSVTSAKCVARVKLLIFSTHEIKYFWSLPKEGKFSFFFLFFFR